MACGRESRERQQQLTRMSNAEIEARLRAPLTAALQQQDEELRDLAWEELRGPGRPRDASWAGACLAIAEYNYALHRYSIAQQAALLAGGTYRKLGDDLAGAVCDLLRAAALNNLQQYSKVLEVSGTARTILTDHGQSADAAICDYVRGKAFHGLGLYLDALGTYDSAKKVLLMCDELADAARCDSERGKALQSLERYQEAIDAYEEARRVFLKLKLPAEAAACDAGRGIGLQGLGLYLEAIDVYEEAKSVFLRLNLPAEAAACDCSRGVALQSLERYQDAIDAYEKAKPILLRHDRLVDAAACDAGRGAALDSLGEYRKAISAFQAAKSCYRTCREFVAAARCDLERGNALQAVEQYDQAVASYRQAKAVYVQHGQVVDAARCDANRGVALARSGQHRKAIAAFMEACPTLERFGQSRALAWAQCGLAVSQQALGDHSGSLDSYLAACTSLDAGLEAISGEGKEFSDFREEFPEAFVPAILLYSGRAAQVQDQDAVREATEASEKAFTLSERHRSAAFRKDLVRSVRRGQIILGSRSPRLVEDLHAIKREQAFLAGRMRQASKRGLTQLRVVAAEDDQRREQLRLDLLRLEERLLVADPETAGLLSPRLPPLPDILNSLAPGEGLVSYLESNEDLVCFLADRSGVVRAQLLTGGYRVARETLASIEERFAQFLGQGIRHQASGGADELARLGTLLLSPAQELGWFENGPSAKSRLRIVPAATLYALPFAALGLPGQGDYLPLIQRAEVMISPQAVTGFYQRRKTSRGTGMVAIVEPNENRMDLLRKAMEAAWPDLDTRWYQEQQGAAAYGFADKIRGRQYLHMSCRRSVVPDARRQSDFVIGSSSNKDAEATLLSELYAAVDLLDLAFVDIRDDDSRGLAASSNRLLALSRAFLHLSRQVVFSLWDDRRQDSGELVAHFYKAVSQGHEPVTALALAQRQSLVSERLDCAHPFFWARLAAMG